MIPTTGNPQTPNATFQSITKFQIHKDTLKYGVAKIVPSIGKLIIISIASRFLLPEEFGTYTLLVVSIAFIRTVTYTWLKQGIGRYFPRYTKFSNIESQLNTILLLQSFTFSAIAAGLWLVLPIVHNISFNLLLACTINFLVSTFFFHVTTILQVKLKSDAVTSLTILQTGIQILLFLLIPFFPAQSACVLIWVTNISYVITFLIGIKHLPLTLSIVTTNNEMLQKSWMYGLPMVGWVFASQILSISDRYMIGYFRSTTEVAIYSSVYDLIAGSIGLVTIPILMAASPIVVTMWEQNKNKDELQKFIHSVSRYYIISTIPILSYVSVMGPIILQLILPDTYQEGNSIIPVIVLGFGITGLANYPQQGIALAERAGLLFLASLLAAMINILLNFVLVPQNGYIAAAYTTTVSYLVYLLIIMFLSRPYLRWNFPWRSFFSSSVLSCGLAWLTYQVLNWIPQNASIITVSFSALIWTIVYMIMLLITKELERDQLRLLLRPIVSLLYPLGKIFRLFG